MRTNDPTDPEPFRPLGEKVQPEPAKPKPVQPVPGAASGTVVDPATGRMRTTKHMP